MKLQGGPSILLYDGECPLCQRARHWVEAHIPESAIQTLACQDSRREALTPMISQETCLAAMQLVQPDGRVYSGERALPQILRHTRYGRFLGWIFYLPGAALGYRLIAKNRLALSAVLIRKKPGEHCSVDRGCE